jgi:aminobenzoyl-glutamate utilization protein B
MTQLHRRTAGAIAAAALFLCLIPPAAVAQEAANPEVDFRVVLPRDDARLGRLKQEVARHVEEMQPLTQQIVDMLFSFAELGYHETETLRYLTGILEHEGFSVERGYAGMPTAWVARWGSGRPVISLGSDIDGIPRASQKPGVAYRDPIIVGAPGHGEGHNSGQAVNIVAALALKRIMERDRIPGVVLWPGVAEELVGAKAYFVRAGLFRDTDAAIFTHVSSDFGVAWGSGAGNALVSVDYTFSGTSAHSAGSPWRGRSALDAVELMNAGWNFRREHLRTQHRSHYVITDGGDQPNVVPQTATVWYYFRETDYPRTKELWAIGDSIAAGAAMMTGTKLERTRVLGSAWPQHFSKPIAYAASENIQRVGMPAWSDADQRLARALQCEMGVNQRGLMTMPRGLTPHVPESEKRGGGSDDIGDVTWTVPTITLRYPANIPGLPGHNWTDAVAMATPIAHKGSNAGAKVAAMTVLDLLMKPALLAQARDYFQTVQTKTVKYEPFIREQDNPVLELNRAIMERYRPELSRYYYDPTRYGSYLEQLGIEYPTVRDCS